MTSLVRPSVRSSVIARPDAAHGNFAIATLRLSFCACASVRPHHATSGSVKTTAGIAARRERDVLARDHFGGDAPFVRRLVREHRLADDVADREDRRLVRAPLLVDHDEAALIDLHARPIETGDRRVRPSADRHQHAIERLLLRVLPRRLAVDARALERDANTLRLRLQRHDARVEQHILHRFRDALGEDVDEIAIGAGQQARRHLDDGHRAAERRVHACRARGRCSRRRPPAAILGMSGRSSAPVESITRGSSTFERRRNRRQRPGRENRVLELHVLGAAADQRRREACARRRFRRSPAGTAPSGASPAGRCRS